MADPNAEVYSKAGAEPFDPKKKPGRFKSDFIWNTNWQEQLKRQDDLEKQQREYQEREEQQLAAGVGPDSQPGSGLVGLSRLSTLDDMSVDLSQQLAESQERARLKREQQQQQEQRRQQQQNQRSRAVSEQKPSRMELRKFERNTRTINRGLPLGSVGKLAPEEEREQAKARAELAASYELLKLEFQAWTLGLGALGVVTAYVAYSQDTAVSYGLGAVGGLTYLRLLSRTVDSVGASGAGAGLRAALAQPRLLIPVVLTLIYARWNKVYADSYDVHLQLIPMLLGFFSYKFAVLGRQGMALLNDISAEMQRSRNGDEVGDQGEGAGGTGAAAAGKVDKDSALNLDRIFVRRVLSE